MTATTHTWKVASTADAAQARAVLDLLLARGGAPALERARFLTSLTARLRACLDRGGDWELQLTVHRTTSGQDGRIDILLRPTGISATGPDDAPTLTCALPSDPAEDGLPADPPLPEALLRADETTAVVLGLLDEQESLLRLHREELHKTNQGVLALHADLEAAALAQRELLEAERIARDEAERARRLLTFLGDASAAVTTSLSPTAVLRRLGELLVPEYAEHVDVWIFDEGDEEPDTGHPRRTRGHSAAAVAAARTGRPQHAAPHPGGLPGTDDLPPSALSPHRPLLAIPLVARRMLGVLSLTAPGPRFDADTCVMLVELARRVAVALDNARRYEQYRDTAEALQRAQLTELPTTSGLLLAARYLPATQGLNIGGDWYDAFHLPDGSLITVIGDVTGHGMHAAVVMGQLRTALRAYAVEDSSPAEILTKLHRMLGHLQPELYATAMIARFQPGEPDVVWASAGHPPAVVRTAHGAVHVLDAKPGVMLGLPVPFTYDNHTTTLPAGSSLVLYTDGLVERRARGIDPGIAHLSQVMAAFDTTDLDHDLDAAADALLERLLHDSERDDDVCVLLCHTPAPSGPPVRPGGPTLPWERSAWRTPSRGSVEAIRREGVRSENL
ncbi:GAF domain-containing SpoIIE family protein phosphatase [Streptomyces sp. NPDC006339]|uniref:PP2C family protein-serine/threonine phosphatase n=1 Tax=Streptomyces sp. NPDC006339 TaxID=3156755 RepID=UPI0033B00D06